MPRLRLLQPCLPPERGVVSLTMPIVAIGIAAAYFHVRPGWSLAAGCLLVAAGAAACRYSLRPQVADTRD
ncbi:unnamed protein product [marine sediment metagenome]|uniref:Uncharacterized protein n=1 Tax=marine sediment metagenome TaxID=412755 RepID=X0Y1S3_9ZZZZ